MKRVATTVLAGLLIVGATWAEDGHDRHAKEAEEAKMTQQTTCPVMGGKINKDLYADHNGKRVYVCCKGCIAPVQKDFAKYAKKVEAAGESVARLQTICPVMGGKINKKHYADVKGRRIYVCCPGCIGKIKADPDTYIKKLEDGGVALDPAPKAETPEKDAHGGHDAHKGHHH